MREDLPGELLMPSVLSCLFIVFLPMVACAFDGEIDLGFGDNGQVALTRPSEQSGNGTRPTGDAAVLVDGSISWVSPLDDGSVWFGRLQRDGSPIPFSGAPQNPVTISACGPSRNAMLVADADGSAVVWVSNCLVRVLGDGSIDSGFAVGTQALNGFRAAGFARDASGRFVLAGKEGQDLAIYRFSAQGQLDVSFGIGGRASVVVPTTNGIADLHALALRPDRRILVGGSRGNTFGPNLVIAQYTEAGVPDPAWSGDGIVDLEPPNGYDRLYATAMALDGDGSLVVAGIGSNGAEDCCRMLSRFDTNGGIVPSFGMRIFTLQGSGGVFSFFEQRDGLVLLPSHRILVGAISFPPFAPPAQHRTQYTLYRTFADGALDASFGHDGWNSYTISDPENVGQEGDHEQMHAIAYDRADDSVLIFGRTFFENNSTGNDYVTMVRAHIDQILADGFDP